MALGVGLYSVDFVLWQFGGNPFCAIAAPGAITECSERAQQRDIVI